jgi:pyruvate,water dikinase
MLGKGRDAGAVLEECALRRRAAEAQLLACIGQEDALLLQRVRKVLTWTQFWVPTLDDRKWHCVARTRLADLILQIGTMLAEEGLVDEPNDLLLFTTDDLLQVAKAHAASAYRGLYETRKRNRRLTPPEHLGKPPALHREQGAESGSLVGGALHGRESCILKGQAFSPGRVVGISRKAPVVNHVQFLDSLGDEHIVVCRGIQTWETDWLSLLLVAKGLVTVEGAQLQHATQIARECGVPFVNVTTADWDSIPDQARIVVDGTAGTVEIIQMPELSRSGPDIPAGQV